MKSFIKFISIFTFFLITINLSAQCTLAAAPCTACAAGETSVTVDASDPSVTWEIFDSGGNMGSFNQAAGTATLTLVAGGTSTFVGLEIPGLAIPTNATNICLMADIEVIEGNPPFGIDVRFETIDFNGPKLEFNSTIDGTGPCMVGGDNTNGALPNGPVLGSPTIDVVIALAEFGGAVDSDRTINISNIVVTYCEPAPASDCSLMADPCAPCPAGQETTTIDVTQENWAPFADEFGGTGMGVVFPVVDPASGTGTITLAQDLSNTFAGIAIGPFSLPAGVTDACITADIDVISGQTPFLFEFRLEAGGGNVGPLLDFNATVDGIGTCSIGGPLSSGTPQNGFAFNSTSYTLVFAVADFSGDPVPEDIIIDISNIVLTFCAPPPPVNCTLMSGNCTPCSTEGCGFGAPIDVINTGDVFNASAQFGMDFTLGENTDPPVVQPNYDIANNMGTLTLAGGTINTFAVSGVENLTLPDVVEDLCFTADIEVLAGQTPFLIEFRIENGTGAPGNGGQALEFNALVDGQGVCSIGGDLTDGIPANGFTFTPGANYSVVVGISDFSNMAVPEDIIVDISNITLVICSSTGAGSGTLEIKAISGN